MDDLPDEEVLLRSVTLQNASTILRARQQSEQELIQAKEALERRTSELAYSLAVMRATLDSTNEGILVTDRLRMITGYNARFTDMWQISDDEIKSGDHRFIMDITRKQFGDSADFIRRIEEIYAESPPETADVLETLDGRTIQRFSRIQVIDGRNAGRVWSFRDITQQRRADEALLDETRVLELLHETGRTIASTLDLKVLLQAVTDAATQLSGAQFGAFFYKGKDENGDNMQLYTLSGAPREAFDKFGHPRATALFGPTFNGEAPIRCDDVLVDPRYGTMAPFYGMPPGHLKVRSYLSVPVPARTGGSVGGLFFGHPEPGIFTLRVERLIVGVAAQAAIAIENARLFEDVKKASEERSRLLEAERTARAEAERISLMKDEFLATLSHELRTPLNSIFGWSQLLLTEDCEPEDLKIGLETIGRNARVQTQLIEDLLDMSRIISGRVQLDVQTTDLVAVIDEAVSSLFPSAEAKQIRLRKIIDPAAGLINGDSSRLQQVFWNLLSNALKFTPKGGRVEINLERVESHLEVSVVDTGIGISPDFLPHVFERFRQADSSTTRRFGGLGIGLSIVKQLVELHGGSVHARSSGEGQGTAFTVCLPIAAIKEKPGVKAIMSGQIQEYSDPAALSGLKILVLDDEVDARILIKRVFEGSHAKVLVAMNADEALSIVETQSIDLIVSDIGMPGKDGYQFIKELRNLPLRAGEKIPILALTAFARSEDRTRVMLAGFQGYVSKPIDPKELIATVASLASRRAAST